jgi:hypothetical protein
MKIQIIIGRLSSCKNPVSKFYDPINGSTARPTTFLKSYKVFFATVDTA